MTQSHSRTLSYIVSTWACSSRLTLHSASDGGTEAEAELELELELEANQARVIVS
jgi:hypothetical protein